MAAKKPSRSNYGALEHSKGESSLHSDAGVPVGLDVMANNGLSSSGSSSADRNNKDDDDNFSVEFLRRGGDANKPPVATGDHSSWRVATACLCVAALFVFVVNNGRPLGSTPSSSSSGASKATTITRRETHHAKDPHEPSSKSAFVTNLARQRRRSRDDEELSGEEESSQPSPLSFTALNFYHVRDGKPAQDYPWLKDVKLVEPYRETTLRVANAREGLFDYRWEVHAPNAYTNSSTSSIGELVATAIGAEATVLFTRLEDNVVVLEELNAAGDVTRRLEETVMVKYVRREIRTLTDDEREELFDAMFTLWNVRADGGEGREIYGPDYTDVWAVSSFHFAASTDIACDHLHDGLGFLTSHSLVSNTFEHSLQLVNPKLTLPYWDFTIESSQEFIDKEGFDGAEPQRLSPVMKESWFGGSDPKDHQVKNGRWAYMEVPEMEQSGAGDVFQRLRAPWNVNARPYLTRGRGQICGARSEPYFPWPTCKMHYDLTMSHSGFYGWVWDAQYDPHGTVHIWMGGVLDCEEAYDRVKSLVGDDVGTSLATLSFIHRKNMYRNGLFNCRDVEDGDNMRDGGVGGGFTCGCLDYDLEQGDDYLTVMDGMDYVGELLEGYKENTKREVVDIICKAHVADGDHLQASSPMDPTFWPIHPTMERLWMFKRLTGTLTDVTWPDHDTTTTTPEGVTRENILSITSDRCAGHRGSDVFPFIVLGETSADNKSHNNAPGNIAVRSGIRSTAVRGGGGEREDGFTLTNREVLRALDPRANDLPYVYDTFRWEHCESEGYDFEDARHSALTSAAAAATAHIEYSSRYVPRVFRYEEEEEGNPNPPPPRLPERRHSGSPK